MIHEVTASTVVETYDFSALSVFVQFAFSNFRKCFSFEAVQPFRLIAAVFSKDMQRLAGLGCLPS